MSIMEAFMTNTELGPRHFDETGKELGWQINDERDGVMPGASMQDFAEQHRLIFDELLEDGGRQKQFELINQGAYIRQGSLGFDITPEEG